MGLGITFSAGNKVTGAQLQAIADQVDSLTAPGWVDYSPSFALTASTTNPTKGNSTYTARYRRAANADLIVYEGFISIGSTFSAGSGIYRWSVPFNASAATLSWNATTGVVWILDNGNVYRSATVKFETAGFFNVYFDGGSGAITNTGPGTAWATGDQLAWSLTYEPA